MTDRASAKDDGRPAAAGIDRLLGLPRLAGLTLSADARRLVTEVGTPAPDGKRFRTSLWEIDPSGERDARRLTRSAQGESGPHFLPNGDLLFVSSRERPDADPDADSADEAADRPALWRLPASGGDPVLVCDPPGGVDDLTVARDSGRLVLAIGAHAQADDLDEDRERADARREAGVSAILLDGYPVRWWDHWLGPRQRRLWTIDDVSGRAGGRTDDEGAIPASPQDVTGAVGTALEEADFDVTPAGDAVVCGWRRTSGPLAERLTDLVLIDLETGDRQVLLDDPDTDYSGVAVSPDGEQVALVAEFAGRPDAPPNDRLVVVDLESGEARPATDDLDVWPASPVWDPSGASVYVTADAAGHRPVFRVDLDDGAVTRLTATGAYSDVCVAPDGSALYGLRSDIDHPPRPVRLDPAAADQDPDELPSPASAEPASSRVERVMATADDGTEVGSWLVLPPGGQAATPAPLVVFIHGGPLNSWNAWHWRWNPHVLADRGYAVLLPDPALSTGYGQDFIARGWGRWGQEPYTDLLAAVDATIERPDVDEGRTAAMGGSFGGYMANWIAGHTDRFDAIITHASIWNAHTMRETSDIAALWDEREFGDPDVHPERYDAISPHLHADDITTPMLVIHGANDYRVPLGEAVALWTQLAQRDVAARFLYFPDENHWIAKPQHVRVWYETVLAFLAEHVLGEDWQRPEHL